MSRRVKIGDEILLRCKVENICQDGQFLVNSIGNRDEFIKLHLPENIVGNLTEHIANRSIDGAMKSAPIVFGEECVPEAGDVVKWITYELTVEKILDDIRVLAGGVEVAVSELTLISRGEPRKGDKCECKAYGKRLFHYKEGETYWFEDGCFTENRDQFRIIERAEPEQREPLSCKAWAIVKDGVIDTELIYAETENMSMCPQPVISVQITEVIPGEASDRELLEFMDKRGVTIEYDSEVKRWCACIPSIHAENTIFADTPLAALRALYKEVQDA